MLTVDKVLAKIRNMTMRELPGGTLFPDTMKQYDEYTIREVMHNAIAHQDYTLQLMLAKKVLKGRMPSRPWKQLFL